MRVLRDFAGREGWHLQGRDLPIQAGVKWGATPFSARHRHRTMAEYFEEQKR